MREPGLAHEFDVEVRDERRKMLLAVSFGALGKPVRKVHAAGEPRVRPDRRASIAWAVLSKRRIGEHPG